MELNTSRPQAITIGAITMACHPRSKLIFIGNKTIGEIDVYAVRDDYATQADPTSTQTFANYGVTAFTVQYWSGSSWVTIPNGAITNNNLVWRNVVFSPITTSKIKVTVNGTVDGVARIAEVEAWTPRNSSIHWLVADQLGTPE
jgi:hypothetical protein